MIFKRNEEFDSLSSECVFQSSKMGRLGFNIVPKKEAVSVQAEVNSSTASAESVEKGFPDQQNERNESLEVSELVLIIDERNHTIKNVSLIILFGSLEKLLSTFNTHLH